MNKTRFFGFWIPVGILIVAVGLCLNAAEAQTRRHPVLILADVSGSMLDPAAPMGDGADGAAKVERMRELVSRIGESFDFANCDLGVYRWRYKAGHAERYAPFLPVGQYDPAEFRRKMAEDFDIEFPVFNRRTPLADMLRQLDEKELSAGPGPITLVLITDGRESFYILGMDKARSEGGAIDPSDRARGPATEIRRLREIHGPDLKLHTIFLAKKGGGGDSTGADLLSRMAALGGGRSLDAADLMTDAALLDDFLAGLCPAPLMAAAPQPAPEPAAAPAPKPEPAPAPASPAGPADSDGDGVPDTADRCPGTPEGATVNVFGCWVLEGVHFKFDRWDLKTESYPILDAAAEVLHRNPGLSVRVEGHTDSYGSDAYNQKLSERRAKTVRQYLIGKGIDPDRLAAVGFGESEPIDTNKTDEGRARNRRVMLTPIR